MVKCLIIGGLIECWLCVRWPIVGWPAPGWLGKKPVKTRKVKFTITRKIVTKAFAYFFEPK